MTGEQFEEELYRENLYFVYEDKCKELEKEIERLNNIINEAIEFINGGKGWKKYKYTYQEQKLLEILQGSDSNENL